MLHVEESFTGKENITEILMEKYICVDDTIIKTDNEEITDFIKKDLQQFLFQIVKIL